VQRLGASLAQPGRLTRAARNRAFQRSSSTMRPSIAQRYDRSAPRAPLWTTVRRRPFLISVSPGRRS